jgi:hypothetical protein
MVAPGSTSMIYFHCFESQSESGSDSFSLTLTNNDYFERHSLLFYQGILWNSHHFPLSFFFFSLPFFTHGLDWLS